MRFDDVSLVLNDMLSKTNGVKTGLRCYYIYKDKKSEEEA